MTDAEAAQATVRKATAASHQPLPMKISDLHASGNAHPPDGDTSAPHPALADSRAALQTTRHESSDNGRVQGWKRGVAALRKTAEGAAEIQIISHNGRRYRLDDKALCHLHGNEEVLELPEDCKCGFWATWDRSDAADFLYAGATMTAQPGADYALLGVDGYGTVREGEGGWRATHQRVRTITLNRRCKQCRRAADGVAAVPSGQTDLWLLEPRCETHRPRPPHPSQPANWWSLADLTAAAGTEVRFGAPGQRLPTRPLASKAWWKAAVDHINRVAAACVAVAGSTVAGAVLVGGIAETELAAGAAVIPALTFIWIGVAKSSTGWGRQRRVSRVGAVGVLGAGIANAVGWASVLAAAHLL